jgi:hypothetical protein
MVNSTESAVPRWAWRWSGRIALFGAIALGIIAGASIWWRSSLVGKPFNCAWSVQGGALDAMWFVPDQSGAVNGFGNTGPALERRNSAAMFWLPAYRASGSFRRIIVPLWPFALASGAFWTMARRFGREQASPEACPACGYSLTGLPKAAACPECGAQRGLATCAQRVLELVLGTRGSVLQPSASSNS